MLLQKSDIVDIGISNWFLLGSLQLFAQSRNKKRKKKKSMIKLCVSTHQKDIKCITESSQVMKKYEIPIQNAFTAWTSVCQKILHLHNPLLRLHK